MPLCCDIKQTKVDYFKFISISNVLKTFWTRCKPYFSNKSAVENCKRMLLTAIKNETIAKKFNNFFSEVVDSLNMNFLQIFVKI